LYLQVLLLSQSLHFGDCGGLPLKVICSLLEIATILVPCSGPYLRMAASRKHPGGERPVLHSVAVTAEGADRA
jgi:uncharacterized iron-regulated membrane protein